jgi:hypothetical protein
MQVIDILQISLLVLNHIQNPILDILTISDSGLFGILSQQLRQLYPISLVKQTLAHM